MRKLVLGAVVVAGGALVAWRIRSRASSSGPAPTPVPTPAPPPATVPAEEPRPAPAPPVPQGPPPATTNGERVVLMSVSSLLERGDDVTHESVVAHVAAGEIDPDEGTVEVLLQRLASAGLLDDDGSGTYRLTPSGEAALMDVSPARPSPAGDAAEELSSPADTA